MNPEQTSTPKEKRIIIPALLVLLILVASYFWFNSSHSPMSKTPAKTANSTPAAGVEVTQGSVSTPSLAGLPSGTPVEVANITENYKVVYTSHNVTQYTITYTSSKSVDAIWKTYSDFMTSAGFAIDKSATNESAGQISGTKGSDTLSVVVTARTAGSSVHLNSLVRQ